MIKLSNHNGQINHCKKVNCTLCKINLHYQTVIIQRLTVSQQLFTWTSGGLSKCPIDKMIGLKGHLTVSRVSRVPCVLAINSFTENFSEVNKCLN